MTADNQQINTYLNLIDKQIEGNQGKNLLLQQGAHLSFVDETIRTLSNVGNLSPHMESVLVAYASEKTIEEFCRINQYFTFDSEARRQLETLYRNLFANIKAQSEPNETVAAKHYQALSQWLVQTNPFAQPLYAASPTDLQPVACAEYSAQLQCQILQITAPMQPVLDIGCGKQAHLVAHLRQQNIEAYGFDRFAFQSDHLFTADWLEYDYGTNKWGTIVSNLGFSNHFRHHHLRADGNFMGYAQKYMDILNALQVGGSFHYAPEVPFIETYLDRRTYRILKVETPQSNLLATIITRLK
jgi:hypothetical protein